MFLLGITAHRESLVEPVIAPQMPGPYFLILAMREPSERQSGQNLLHGPSVLLSDDLEGSLLRKVA